MTAPLDPEIKAMRAIVRAIESLDSSAQRRVILWLMAHEYGTTQDAIERRLATSSLQGELPKSHPWTGIPA
jgi:hypothetical protein